MLRCEYALLLLLLLCSCQLVVAADNGITYRLKAQDRIAVNVMRHQELTQTYTVPPDGLIDFPRTGGINVIGKTTVELAAEIKAQLDKVLREAEVTVTLVDARPQIAYVLGAVMRPGPYTVTNGMRVTELLAAAGDLSNDRETMLVSVIRTNQSIPVDLPAAIEGTNPTANLAIQEGDLLWVQPPQKITVVVSGQVRTPGVVKIAQKSTLLDALAQAGDLLDRPERVQISLLRGKTTALLKWDDKSTNLQDGDVILVEKEQVARVYINGHVKAPGAYELPTGAGVLELIALAGGVLTNPALSQVTIVRKDGRTESINLVPELVEGHIEKNPKLASGDQVIIPESTKRVSVLGWVNRPGPIPFNESKRLTVIDAISTAGGEQKRAKLGQVMVIRTQDNKVQRLPVDVNAILKKGKQELNIPLRPDDIVYVPEVDRPDWTGVLNSLYQVGLLATLHL